MTKSRQPRGPKPGRRVVEMAQDYCRRGFQPLPIPLREKAPTLAGWPQFTCTVDDVPEHFDLGDNVGLILGARSGHLVDVDLDCEEARLLAPAFLPATGMVHGRQGNPTSHWWYRAEVAKPIKLTDGKGATLVELRTNGQQTLVPPSVHPSGVTVRWEREGDPTTIDADALRAAVRRLGAAALLARHWPAQGSRNDSALALGGWLLRHDWSDDEATRFVREVARAAGDEEASKRAATVGATARALTDERPVTGAPSLAHYLGDEVVRRVGKWLGFDDRAPVSRGSRGRNTWAEPVPLRRAALPAFPVDTLPPWLAAWVQATAVETQTPPDLAGLISLPVLATAARAFPSVKVREGWSEPLCLYTLVVLGSGNRKSAVVSAATAPLQRFEQQLAGEIAPLNRDANARRALVEADLAKARRSAKDAPFEQRDEHVQEVTRLQADLDAIEVQHTPRLFVNDITAERLAILFSEQRGRMAILSAEGRVFRVMAGLYSDAGSANFEVYLQAHSGEPLRISRIARGDLVVDSPRLFIGLAIQPGVLTTLRRREEFRTLGLLARFLFALPTSLVGFRDPCAPAVPPIVAATYDANLLTLLSANSADGLAFSPEANQRIVEFLGWLEPQLRPGGDLSFVAEWASKLSGAVVRIAALLHLGDCLGRSPDAVPAGAVDRAIRIGQYLIPHAQAALAKVSSTDVEEAEHVLAWLKREGRQTISRRDLHRAMRPRFEHPGDLDPCLQLLEEHGWLRRAADPPRGPGRRPSASYDVNLRLFSSSGQNGQNGQNTAAGADSGHSGHSGTEEDAHDEPPGSMGAEE